MGVACGLSLEAECNHRTFGWAAGAVGLWWQFNVLPDGARGNCEGLPCVPQSLQLAVGLVSAPSRKGRGEYFARWGL